MNVEPIAGREPVLPVVPMTGQVRDIVRWVPDLRRVSEAVGETDREVLAVVADLAATLQHHRGLGLSAIQIGVPMRIVVVKASQMNAGAGVVALINPEIVSRSSDKVTGSEACLSLPGLVKQVRRPATIALTYRDVRGAVRQTVVSGLLARVVQHEVDHLDGLLITDRSRGLQ